MLLMCAIYVVMIKTYEKGKECVYSVTGKGKDNTPLAHGCMCGPGSPPSFIFEVGVEVG